MQKTLAVIDLDLLKSNALFVKKILGERKFYAVVKADAYGHGGQEVARALSEIVDGFCVAITDEGIALRLAGISNPVLVFTPPLGQDDVLRAEFYNLTLTVTGRESAKLSKGVKCHIKVNTGMNRYGCNLCDLPELLNIMAAEDICGVYSHLYSPASSDDSGRQLALFNAAEELVKAKNPQAVAHLAASGGILSGEKFLKDGARCGILLYGYAPEGFSAKISPVMKVYARRAQTTPFVGGGVGYSRAEKDYEVLNTYRLGYADGFARGVPLGESNLCMDAFIKEGGGELQLILGDAAEYAKRCGTIPYEVLCSAVRRAERVYEERFTP